MKTLWKKTVSIIFAVSLILSTVPAIVSAATPGEVIDHAQPTDIVASINGYQLQSYNVNDYTYICVEDLQHYGFDVSFDMDKRTLSFTRNNSVTIIDPQNTNPDFMKIGSLTYSKEILYTDIVTYANGEAISGSNINGRTIINFDELARFGAVSYDDSLREISLTLDGVEHNPIDLFAKEMQKQIDENDSTWTWICRAKGDIFCIHLKARNYVTQEAYEHFYRTLYLDEMRGAEELLNVFREYDLPISAIQVEYRNADGMFLTSFQKK